MLSLLAYFRDRALHWTCAMVLLSSSCLVPQDDVVRQEAPPERNSPPRVVKSVPAPQQPITLRLASNCPAPPGFSINVEDPNVADTIVSYWFVDPDNAHLNSTIQGPTLLPGATTLRDTPISSPQELFNAIRSAATRGQYHIVEVVFADGLVGQGLKPAPRPSTESGLADETWVVSWMWNIITDLTPCQ